MPIKLPKGFPRRKSSGNVLDESPNTSKHGSSESTSSFRVIPRPHSSGKSLDAGSTLRSATDKPLPRPRTSFEEDSEDLFAAVRGDIVNRGSGTTANSLSTAPYDSATSSTRYSNSSTNPSSVDSGSGRNVRATGQRSYDEVSHSQRGGFLKSAGRTFSFGLNRNNSKEAIPPAPQQPPETSRRTTMTESRDRTTTVSSITTATPPRLDDSSFSIKESDDDFGNMFADMGPKSSRENFNTRPTPGKPALRAFQARSVNSNGHTVAESSSHVWAAPNSNDGLVASNSPSRTVVSSSPQRSALRNMAPSSALTDNMVEENMFEDSPLRRSPEPVTSRTYSSTSSRPPPSSFPTATMTRTRTQSNGASSIQHSNLDASEFEIPPVDHALFANAKLATQYEEKASSPLHSNPNKIMTPAEFERYKQHKEDTRRYNKVFGRAVSDDGSGDEYEDDEDDDQEREKQAIKQRKKQEAHLAVYRQQMMKVTGDAPNVEQPRPATSIGAYPAGNSSQLDLNDAERRMSQLALDGKQFSSAAGALPADEEDEDEDVPLGILAAHGFPNKNRPPTRLGAASSNPNLRHVAQAQSVAGGESNRSSLPAFARHLPPDPYYGASIVHQAERTPLAMHTNMSQTHLVSQPQPSGAATAHPLHPAGLVGVIAGEERARAMRRGSPNPPGAMDMPMGTPPIRGMPQHIPGFPGQGMMMPPMLSPAEQAQLQMSQSMTQMMQMQMQWMQQMQQMQGMMGQNPNMQMPMMGMPGMPGTPPIMPQLQQNGSPMMQPQNDGVMHRPQSVPLQNANGGGRRMSTLSPSMAGWNYSSPAVPQLNVGGSVYAHSIAPSERSNVGLASRYRPVSTIQADAEPKPSWQKRASTFTSTTFRPWTNENNNSKAGMPTIRSVSAADEDDDEQGWAEMKARKEKKQKSWKLRKGGNNTLQELYNAPA